MSSGVSISALGISDSKPPYNVEGVSQRIWKGPTLVFRRSANSVLNVEKYL